MKIKLTLKRKVFALVILASLLPVPAVFLLVNRFQAAVSTAVSAEVESLAMENVAQTATDVYGWLISELDIGQNEGKLMIIAAHLPIGVIGINWRSFSAVSEADLIAKLHTYPNLLAWLAGHRHRNIVTAFTSPDPAHPEQGFWQIETASLRNFPQQFRTFEIVLNSDSTISIVATNVDPSVKEGTPAAISRSYAVAAGQFFNQLPTTEVSGAYNAVLVKQLSEEMKRKIKIY